jgi:hypothetical protein
LKPSDPISAPLFHENKWILFRGSQWTSGAKVVPETEKNKIREELLSKKRTSILESYIQSLVKSAKIPDEFRKKYQI